ncbi:MAG: DNA-binding domain-containing protein [Bacteroidales bacterium]
MSLKYALVENPLTKNPNDYMAKPIRVRSYSIDEVVEQMLDRGSSLTKTDILAVLEMYHTQLTDLVADGNAISTPFFHIAPSIAGVFNGSKDCFDNTRHKLRIKLNAGTLLHKAQQKIRVEKVTANEHYLQITQLIDIKTSSMNRLLTPNYNLRINGVKIKVLGEQDSVGVYFVSEQDAKQRFKVKPSDIIINKPSELIVIIPNLPKGDYRLEVSTQFNAGRVLLKAPRTGQFHKTLSVQ